MKNLTKWHVFCFLFHEMKDNIQDLAKDIFDAVREPLMLLNGDLRVVFVNNSYLSTFQVTPDEILGLSFFEVGKGQWDIPELRNLIEELLVRNTPFENFLVRGDFNRIGYKAMALSGRRIKRREGELILLEILDVTERIKAEERFQRLYNVLLLINAVHRLISLQKDEVEFLQKACAIFTEKGDFSGAQVFLPDKEGKLHSVAKSGNETLFKTFKESIFSLLEMVQWQNIPATMKGDPLSISAFPLRYQGHTGAFVFLSTAAHSFTEEEEQYLKDVTEDIAIALELIEAERRLRESEKRYRTLFEGAPDIMGVMDKDGKIIAVNKMIEKELGWKVEDIVGKNFKELKALTHESIKVVSLHFTKFITRGIIPSPFEISCVKKDGSIVPYEVNFLPVNYELESTEIQFIMRNISLRKEAEGAIRRSRNQLKAVLFGATKALIGVIEERDPYTRGHSEGVARLATAIAQRMEFSDEEITGLYISGLLHDIGKVAIPMEILVKPGKLDEKEMALVREHPLLGYEILKEIDFPWPVALVALQHHERLDGSGYPNGLKAEEIIPEAKIVAVADVVDAMSHHRPYRPAREIREVVEELLQGRGKLYDKRVVDACLSLIKESPELIK